MPPPDPSQAYLKSRGCPPHIVTAGLTGLLDDWRNTIAGIRAGYNLTLDDYLNDMDTRQLIEETLPHTTTRGHKQAIVRLYELDESVRPFLKSIDKCLWGAKAEAEHGWSPDHNWWYYSVPMNPGPQLASDLGRTPRR
jgi:hypothetical protein